MLRGEQGLFSLYKLPHFLATSIVLFVWLKCLFDCCVSCSKLHDVVIWSKCCGNVAWAEWKPWPVFLAMVIMLKINKGQCQCQWCPGKKNMNHYIVLKRLPSLRSNMRLLHVKYWSSNPFFLLSQKSVTHLPTHAFHRSPFLIDVHIRRHCKFDGLDWE